MKFVRGLAKFVRFTAVCLPSVFPSFEVEEPRSRVRRSLGESSGYIRSFCLVPVLYPHPRHVLRDARVSRGAITCLISPILHETTYLRIVDRFLPVSRSPLPSRVPLLPTPTRESPSFLFLSIFGNISVFPEETLPLLLARDYASPSLIWIISQITFLAINNTRTCLRFGGRYLPIWFAVEARDKLFVCKKNFHKK